MESATKRLLVALSVVLALLFGVGEAKSPAASTTQGNDSGTVTSVTVDSTGHLTVSWSLACTGPTASDGICPVDTLESLSAVSVCVIPNGVTYGGAGCAAAPVGHDYMLPLFQNSVTFTTPDTYPPGQYQVSVEVDDLVGACQGWWDCNSITVWMPWYSFTLADTQPPSTPANLHGTPSAGGHTAVLSWNRSTDNVGVVGYRIYRSSALVATAPLASYRDAGLNPKTTYQYQVVAIDAAGNASPASNTVSITTLAAPVHVVRKVTAICRDGSKSYIKVRTKACAGHRGVRKWLDH